LKNSRRNRRPGRRYIALPTLRTLPGTLLALGLFAAAQVLPAQSAVAPIRQPTAPAETIASAADLPDDPGTFSSSAAVPAPSAPDPAAWPFRSDAATIQVPPLAPLYHKYIEPTQSAQPLTSADKVLFGAHQLMSPFLLLTVITAAGYEQALNASPNYGTDKGAYGERLGAAAIRDASQTIFSDSIMSAVLHQDPRYYVMGKGHNAVIRAGYAVSRVLVTRNDNGSAAPNLSLFSGFAGAAALTNAYYPSDNRGFSETAKSFGGSLGGAAVSNVVREFLPDILHAVHLE
jgi:hypothetical protein